MCTEIEQAVKQIITKIQMTHIAFISSSSHSAAVIGEEGIEVVNKPFKFILSFEVISISMLHVHVNKKFVVYLVYYSC